jgi:hypothetical protein
MPQDVPTETAHERRADLGDGEERKIPSKPGQGGERRRVGMAMPPAQDGQSACFEGCEDKPGQTCPRHNVRKIPARFLLKQDHQLGARSRVI